jgi:hypothetical protein
MLADHPIIDADGHVVEQDRELRAYLPSPWREKDWTREYSFFPLTDGWMRGMSSLHEAEVPDAPNWLSFLDEAGISATVLYPSNGLFHGQIRNVQWAVGVARAYNDWLYDRFSRQSPRLKGVAQRRASEWWPARPNGRARGRSRRLCTRVVRSPG